MCSHSETGTQEKKDAVVSHLSHQCAEEIQALPRWEISRDHGPAPGFGARAFPLSLRSRQENAGQVMHAWVAQEDGEEVISGTKLALVRTKSISQGGSCCAAALVVLPTGSFQPGFTAASRRPLCQSVTRD